MWMPVVAPLGGALTRFRLCYGRQIIRHYPKGRSLIVVLTLLLAAVILAVAAPKVAGQAQMRERMARLGVSPARTRTIGDLEVLAVAGLLLGLLWWPIAVAAAVGLTLLLIGAAGYHARAKDPIPVVLVPVVFALATAALAVLHILNA